MIKKETFVNVLNLIKEQDETNSEVGKALELICDSWVMYGFKDKYKDALNLLLNEIFDDKESDWIGWWLYEDVEKKITFNDDRNEIYLNTAEDLYDFLLNNLEEKNGGRTNTKDA